MSGSFAELFEESLSLTEITPGALINSIVVDVNPDFVTVSAGLRSEGIIPADQFKDSNGIVTVKPGDVVEVSLESVEDGFGDTKLSREKARYIRTWEVLTKAFENEDVVTGRIINVVEGGFTVDLGGVDSFLSFQDADLHPTNNSSDMVGNEIEIQLMDLDQDKKSITVSQQAVLNDENIKVWLVFRQYRISFRYKLLSELGEISHFILQVFSKQSITEQDLELVTGLDRKQLSPVFTRLVGLGFIEKNKTKLTKKGKVVAHILEYIHEYEIEIAIDRHYHYKYKSLDMFLVPNDCDGLTIKPSDAIELPQVSQISYGKQEDCFKQSERIQRHLPTLLPKLVPESEKILSELGERWGTEWDVSVRAIDDTKGVCTNITLKTYEKVKQNTYFNLYTPLTLLKTYYTLPEGLKWDTAIPPSTYTAVFSENDQQIYDTDYSVTDTNEGEALLFDDNDSIDQEYAKALIGKSLQRSNSSSDLFSRQYSFSTAWQVHQYTYEELINSLQFSNLIKV